MVKPYSFQFQLKKNRIQLFPETSFASPLIKNCLQIVINEKNTKHAHATEILFLFLLGFYSFMGPN